MPRTIKTTWVLRPPLVITSRLCPGVVVGDSTINLVKLEESENKRINCTFLIDTPEFKYEDTQMAVAHSKQSSIDAIFVDFLGFLEAAVYEDAHDPEEGHSGYGELFPPHVTQWAIDHEPEISAVRCDLERSDD